MYRALSSSWGQAKEAAEKGAAEARSQSEEEGAKRM